MKNKKNIIIITVFLLISIIIIISVYSILNSSKIKRENKNEITEAYQNLTNEVDKYNNIRTKYNEKISSFILTSYEEEHAEYIDLLTKYNETIKKIDNSVNRIKDKCDILYNDININKICSNYELIYEKLINLYITDLNMYNSNIKKYNEYNNANIGLFELIHTEYIDYNNDNKYEGRELNEENKEK